MNHPKNPHPYNPDAVGVTEIVIQPSDGVNDCRASDCSASPVHMGYYDDKGRFIPADLAKFIDTLNGMTHEQLSVVAAQCIHLMCELERQND